MCSALVRLIDVNLCCEQVIAGIVKRINKTAEIENISL
jgi:hypothetical protein